MEKVYMAVTSDKYELPVYVTNNPYELAAVYGMTASNLWSYITRGTVRRTDNVRFIRIRMEDEQEEEK